MFSGFSPFEDVTRAYIACAAVALIVYSESTALIWALG